MFQKFGATIVEEEKITKKAAKVAMPKPKVAAKDTKDDDGDDRAHYECFRF